MCFIRSNRSVLWPWRGRVTAHTQNWLELAGTGATGVKRCLHYEIPEKSRRIVGGASVTVCGKKRKGTGKTGNFTGKSDIITDTFNLSSNIDVDSQGRWVSKIENGNIVVV